MYDMPEDAPSPLITKSPKHLAGEPQSRLSASLFRVNIYMLTLHPAILFYTS